MCLDMSVVVLLGCNRLTRLADLIMDVMVRLVYFSPSSLVLVMICLASCLSFALLSRCYMTSSGLLEAFSNVLSQRSLNCGSEFKPGLAFAELLG